MTNETLPRRLRTLLLLRSLVLVALSIIAVGLRGDDVRVRGLLLALGGAATATVLIGAVWLYSGRRLVGLAVFQLMADAAFSAALVAVTGGVESVFIFVLPLTVLTGAATLERRGAILAAVACGLLYLCVAVLQTQGALRSVGGSGSWLMLLPAFATNVTSMGLVAVLGDFLTRRLAATKMELVRLEELTTKVLQSLPSGVVTLDGHGDVIYANPSARELLHVGAAAEGGEGKDFILPAALRERTQGVRFETEVMIKGAKHVVGGSVAALVGAQAGRVLVFQDLTTLRKLEQDVVRSRRLAELGRLSAALAHEIRNPLAAMLGCLDLLRQEPTSSPVTAADDERARMLNIVHREAQRLSGLVTDFLTYSRPSPSRVVEVNVAMVVREVIESARMEPSPVVTMPASLMAYADADQLRQVIWNLLRNATQADPKGNIAVSGKGGYGSIELCVDDGGPGLSAEAEERLFEPFFTTRENGTGLGLATCYHLVRQVGGDLRAGRSSLGGARFMLTLSETKPATVEHTTLPPAAPH